MVATQQNSKLGRVARLFAPRARAVRGDAVLRRQIRVGAITVLLVNLAIGLVARHQQQATINYAINVYDTAFIATNYIHLADVAFQHYADERLSPLAADGSSPEKTLGNVLDNLDVAIERADSPHSRDMAKEVRGELAALAGDHAADEELKGRLTDLQQQIEHLGSHASAVGLEARDNVEALSSRTDTLLLILIGSSMLMVIVALILLERMISQAQLARVEGAARDAQIAAAEQQNATRREEDLATKSAQADRMSAALDSFMRRMMTPTEILRDAAKDLNSNAASLSDMAARAKAQSVTAAASSQVTADVVQSAAMIGDELAQTVAEIEAHALESSRLAKSAVSEVTLTKSTIDELAAVAQEISEVTDLISSIAAQTNLLALNATIEAARAGQSGRGFAVVAQEVKTLASQTANATQDISRRVEAIQSVTHRSVDAIHGVSQTIKELEAYSVRIASAVEQQAQAAKGIATNLSSASANVVNVNGAITEVESVGNRTAHAAEMLSSASVNVTDQAKSIHEQVRAFTEEIRAIQSSSAA